jgi:hypothetical protein
MTENQIISDDKIVDEDLDNECRQILMNFLTC